MATFFYSGTPTNELRELIINLPSDYKKIHEIMKTHSDTFNQDLLLYIERFPYYIDDIFFTDALVFPNYLRRMSMHPNEYYRAKALKTISYIDSTDILSTLIKPITDNLFHSNEAVRRNSYLALNQLIKHNLIEYNLNDLLESETHLTNRFLIYKLKKDKEMENISDLGIILSLNEGTNLKLAEEHLESANVLVKMHCILHFIRYGDLNKEEMTKFVQKMVELLKNNAKLRFMKKVCLEEIYDKGIENIDILNLYESGNSEVNMLIFNFVRKNNKIIEVINLYNFILNIFESNNKKALKSDYMTQEDITLTKICENDTNNKIMVLEMIKELVSDTYYYNDNNDIILRKYLQENNPKIQYKVLEVIDEIHKKIKNKKMQNIILESLSYITFGKIIRKTIEIMKSIGNVNDYFSTIEHFKTDKLWYITQIYNFINENKEIFIKEDPLQEKTVNLLLSITSEENIRIEALVNMVLRKIIQIKKNPNLKQEKKEIKKTEKSNFSFYAGKTKLPEILNQKKENSFEIKAPKIKNKEKIIQLSSINDPIYIECFFKIVNDTVILDLILINNTNFDLKDIKIDFVTSENVFCMNEINQFLLKRNSVKEIKSKYRVKDWNDMIFIGEVQFVYTTEERNVYKMGLDAIKISVLEFMVPNKMDLEEFRRNWGTLVWENVSTLRKKCNSLYDLITEDAKLDELSVKPSFDVSIFSVKVGNKVILGNLVRNASSVVRIRGEDEEIVKNLGQSFGQFLREGS